MRKWQIGDVTVTKIVEMETVGNADSAEAHATRRRVFAEYAGTPTLIIGTHFAGATAGHIVADGDAYRLEV